MGTNECSQPASKSSWGSQDFGDVKMMSKMTILVLKSSGPQWINEGLTIITRAIWVIFLPR